MGINDFFAIFFVALAFNFIIYQVLAGVIKMFWHVK
jgi:hypothetical protein